MTSESLGYRKQKPPRSRVYHPQGYAAAGMLGGSLVAGYMTAMLVMPWGSQPPLSNPPLAFFWFLGGLAAGR